MASFTRLDRDEVAELARAFGLGELRDHAALSGGTINSNFSLRCAGGRFFLRVNEGKAVADVAYEAELVAALVAGGVRAPEPRRGPDGRAFVEHRGRLVSVFPWVEGEHRELGEVTAGDAGRLGAELARLHRAGLPLAARFSREGIYTTDRIAARLAGFAGSTDPTIAAAVPTLQAEMAWLAGHSAARAAAPHGIIHGDLFRDNVLFRDGEVVALIDFEQASSGSLVYDLAVCLNAWCFVEAFDLALVGALIDGYQSVRRLAAEERAALPIEARAAAARFTVTRITDVYLARSAVPGKDFRRYLARLEAWRGLAGDLGRMA